MLAVTRKYIAGPVTYLQVGVFTKGIAARMRARSGKITLLMHKELETFAGPDC